jgi:hypothetical protein
MVQTKTYSQVFVRPVIEEDSESLPRDEKNTDLQMHANGYATLTFIQNHDGLSIKTHFEPHPSETLKVSFSEYGRMLQQAAEEICSTESSQEIVNFVEPCVHRLAHCDEAKCLHDLVRLMVRL